MRSLEEIALKVAGLERSAIVVKTPNKDEWCVKSEKNPDWSGGCYSSKEEAEKRLKEIEMFKHMKKKK